MTHDRQPTAPVGGLGGGDVRIEAGAQLRVAAPVVDLVGVPDLRAVLGGERDPVRLGPHDAGDGAELDPALEQLGGELVGAEREEAADVGAPGADSRQAHGQAVRHRRRKPVEAPPDGRVAAPDDLRARRHPGVAGADEAAERPAGAAGEVLGGAVVLNGVEVVHLGSVHAVRRARVERRVLAEVLHPAVVAVGDGLGEQLAEHPPTGGAREVELRDEELAVGAVVVDVGIARRRLGQRAALDRFLVGPRVVRADHRVEVRRRRQSLRVEPARPGALLGAPADVIAAGQVVRVGLAHRDRRIGAP